MTTNMIGKVLLADDEEQFRSSICELLRSDGFQCDCAANGAEALGLLAKGHYDVLIADICMDGNSDLSLVRNALQISPGLPVVLVTAYPSLETAIPSVQLLVAAYLKKPVEYMEIRGQVLRAIEKSVLYRMFTDIRSRLVAAEKELSAVQGRLSPACSPEDYIPISLVRDVASVLSQILVLRAKLGCRDMELALCKLLDCGFHPNYQDAIHDTIEILKRTKTSFKSKDLGALRLRLESMVQKSHGVPAPHISRARIAQQTS